MLIHQNLHKKVDFANLKSNLDKLDIDKLKNVPSNLRKLKIKVDKLDADKLVPVPVYLGKLRDVGKNDVAKEDVYNAKIKNIDKIPDITDLAINASLNAKINKLKGEIPDITDLATNASLNAKINEVKGKILNNITHLATNTTLRQLLLESLVIVQQAHL